jgi:integrase/recombinase XerC
MGRPSKVRYRADRDAWVTVIDGQYRTLARGKRNRAEAMRVFHQLQANRGKPGRTASITIAELCDRLCVWTAESGCSPLTVENYRTYLDGFIEHVGRETPASTIRVFHVEGWLKTHTWGQSSRSGAIAAVKRAFRWGTRQGFLDANPLDGMDKPAILRRESILSPADELRVIADARGKLKPFLEFLRETGCRPSEAARIEAGFIDWEVGKATMPGKTSRRTQRPRVIYLTARAVEILRPLAEHHPEGPLFRNRSNRPWTRHALAGAMGRLRKRLKIEHGCTCESFRHGWVTDAKMKLPNSVVAELAGHTSTAMVDKHYGHISERTSELSAAAQQVRDTGTRTDSPVASPSPESAPPAAPPGKTSSSARSRRRRS